MPGACGLACEVCGNLQICGGCMAGTDPRAPGKLEQIKISTGYPCPMLACAIQKKEDYCLGCTSFPCDTAYLEVPYSKKTLDMIKGMKGMK